MKFGFCIALFIVSILFLSCSSNNPIPKSHFLKMQEESGVIVNDYGNNPYNFVNYGAIVSKEGKIGKSYYFLGINTYIIAENVTNDFTRGFTFSAWLNYEDIPTNGFLFCFNGLGSIYIYNNNNTSDLNYYVIHENNVSQGITGTNCIVKNEWINITITHNSDGIARIYKNGIIVGSGKLWLPVNKFENRVLIGSELWGRGGFKGKIEAVRILNRGITEKEVEGIYNGGLDFKID